MLCTSAAELIFGTTMPCGPALAACRRSASCHSVSSPLTRMVTSREPYSPEAAAAHTRSRASSLASGATASSRSRISAWRAGSWPSPARARWRPACRAPSGAGGASSSAWSLPECLLGGRVISGLEFRIAGGQLVGQVRHHLALLERGVVLHLAVDHHRAGAVAHGRDDPAGPRHVLRCGREHLLGDVDLHRVQAPRTDAAEQERVAELVLAAHDVLDV